VLGIKPWPNRLSPDAVPTDLSQPCKTAEGSPVSIMISSEAGQSENRGPILDMSKRFFCSPQFSHVLGTLFPHRWRGQGVKLSNHLHLVPRIQLHGSVPPLHPTASGLDAELVKHREEEPASYAVLLSLLLLSEMANLCVNDRFMLTFIPISWPQLIPFYNYSATRS
jgi:hypothetical protein